MSNIKISKEEYSMLIRENEKMKNILKDCVIMDQSLRPDIGYREYQDIMHKHMKSIGLQQFPELFDSIKRYIQQD